MKIKHFILGINLTFFLCLGNTQTLDQKQGKCLAAIQLVKGVGGEITLGVRKLELDLVKRFQPIYKKINVCTNGSAEIALINSCISKVVSKSDGDFYVNFIRHSEQFDSYVTKENSGLHLLGNCGEFFKQYL